MAAADPVHIPATDTLDIYKRGEEESKRELGNAIEAFGSAVKADPQFPTHGENWVALTCTRANIRMRRQRPKISGARAR